MSEAPTDKDISDIATGLKHVWGGLSLEEVIGRAIRLGISLAGGASPNPANVGLTPRQAELLGYIRKHIANHGWAPTYLQMMDFMRLRSKSGIHRMVTALESRGYIRRTPHLRQTIADAGAPVASIVEARSASRVRASAPILLCRDARTAALENYGRASASQIAAAHGVTRNSIIGHWFRLRRAGLLSDQSEAA
jgi:hypothetical protein